MNDNSTKPQDPLSAADLDRLLRLAGEAIDAAVDEQQLEALRVRYLGRKGEITGQLKHIGRLPPDQRREAGQAVNRARDVLQELIGRRREALQRTARREQLELERLDVSLPGRSVEPGATHPLTRTRERLEDILERMGFEIAEGPEVEDDFHNFEALNFPANHPARAMHDTFYLPGQLLLRTHTSPVQVHYMQRHKPPLRVISSGKVYRCDYDPTHSPMFHQIEGLYVDERVSLAELKGVVSHALEEFFESKLHVRFRPSYFPFTEPSAEADIAWPGKTGEGDWLEVLGCGMVHPEVFRHVGIDAERYTGFAFGIGVERLAMLRYGVDDLRLFFDNDLRFLEQFR